MRDFYKKPYQQLESENIELGNHIKQLQYRLNQHHEDSLPAEIRSNIQLLNKNNHTLTVENRQLKAAVQDLKAELKASQADLEAAEWWVK